MNDNQIELMDLANEAAALVKLLHVVQFDELSADGIHGLQITLMAIADLIDKIRVCAGGVTRDGGVL